MKVSYLSTIRAIVDQVGMEQSTEPTSEGDGGGERKKEEQSSAPAIFFWLVVLCTCPACINVYFWAYVVLKPGAKCWPVLFLLFLLGVYQGFGNGWGRAEAGGGAEPWLVNIWFLDCLLVIMAGTSWLSMVAVATFTFGKVMSFPAAMWVFMLVSLAAGNLVFQPRFVVLTALLVFLVSALALACTVWKRWFLCFFCGNEFDDAAQLAAHILAYTTGAIFLVAGLYTTQNGHQVLWNTIVLYALAIAIFASICASVVACCDKLWRWIAQRRQFAQWQEQVKNSAAQWALLQFEGKVKALTISVQASPSSWWWQDAASVTVLGMSGEVVSELEAPPGSNIGWLRGEIASKLEIPLLAVQLALPSARLLQDEELIADLAETSATPAASAG